MKELIIDGYNLLHCAAYPASAQQDLEDRRNALIRRLETYAARQGRYVFLVFDGRGEMQHQRPARLLRIAYSSSRSEADDVIRAHIRAAKHPGRLTVITSDREIRSTARDHGAAVIGSDAFCSELFRREASGENGGEESDRELSDTEVAYWMKLFEQGDDDNES